MLLVGVGSSPLTRGKRGRRREGQHVRRLIPAHAGKTLVLVLGESDRRAHPRSRGENSAPPTPAPSPAGSSPLTRGKRGLSVPRSPGEGLIPAHAGKTSTRRRATASGGAHPRSRGENERLAKHGKMTTGSSPLTRGKRI